MNWILIIEIIYIVILILVCLKIIFDTRSTTKTLAYLLFAVFVPLAGIIFYLFFGTNYRKKKIYSKKLIKNEVLTNALETQLYRYSKTVFEEHIQSIGNKKELVRLLLKGNKSPLTARNAVKLLVNGEEKFPELLQALRNAKDHIHIEYYIFEDDEIGRSIEDVLIEKANEGIAIRFIYDDFGSRSLRKRLVKRLRANSIAASPFFEINFIAFANRINYRNHRKIIIIDGRTGFVGGINVSDKYINKPGDKKRYWRDTHLRIDGPGVHQLQYLFLCDWNFCAHENLSPNGAFFPATEAIGQEQNKIVQIAASGPDSERPILLFSILKSIELATNEILITSPYFIPGDSLLDALTIASLSGISVKLLVPGISDSYLVNFAAQSYYNELLKAGVEIYLYKKGFVHAKTLVIDREIAIVGTANMDFRSFDLNFEVNALLYDTEIAIQLSDVFYDDITHSEKIDPMSWMQRPRLHQLFEKIARLVSPLL